MSIKSLVVLLGVTAVLLCLADAAVTVNDCKSGGSSIKISGITISPSGSVPLMGGTITVAGSVSVNVGSSTVSDVTVKVEKAKASIAFFSEDLCSHSELAPYCGSGKHLTCTDFQTLMGVTGLCTAAGAFRNKNFDIIPITETIPQRTTFPVSGKVDARVKVFVGDGTSSSNEVGCVSLHVPLTP